MSLIHWWPLNGNTNDYGVNNIALINNGATVNSAGKIGSCYYFDGNTSYLQATIEAGLFDGTGHPFSFTFWMKFTDELVDRKIIFGDYSLANPYFNIEMSYGSASYSGRIRFCWSNGCDYWFTVATGIKDTWQHYAITYDGINKISLYKDGTFIESATATLNAASSGTYYIGRDGRTGSTALKGYLNDFRIYNHALSVKEVKEISKGLVLHYNFEDEYIEPTTNLIEDGNTFSSWSSYGFGSHGSKTILDGATPNGINKFCRVTDNYTNTSNAAIEMARWVTSTALTNGQQVAFSAYVRGVNNTVGKNCFIHIYNSNDIDTVSTTIKSITLTANWQRIKGVFTWNKANTSSTSFSCYVVCEMMQGEQFDFCEPQFEAKDHATPYVNGARSTGKIYDNSGYGYNGTICGNIKPSSDSAVGKHSIYSPAGANYVERQNFPIGGFNADQQFTINAWIKIVGYIGSDWNTIFRLAATNARDQQLHFCYNASGNIILSQFSDDPQFTTNVALNTWAMVTWVHYKDDSTAKCKYFVNGKQIGNTQSYSGLLNIQNNARLTLFYDSIRNSYGANLHMGDFKIYSTALSTEDILAEYNRKAAIDRNGNLFTSKIIETGWSGKTILTLSDIFNTNAVYVDKTSWAETIMDAARVNASFQPATTYYIRYRVQRLAYPVSHSYTTQAWAKTMLYNDSLSIDCAQLSQTAYTSMAHGECKWVTGSFTTPSSLSNWRMLFYSARWSGSSSDWGSNAEVETVRVSDFYISTTPFTHTNVSIENENLIYSAEIHELSGSSVKIFKNGELRTSSVEEL